MKDETSTEKRDNSWEDDNETNRLVVNETAGSSIQETSRTLIESTEDSTVRATSIETDADEEVSTP